MAELAKHKVETKKSLDRIEALLMNVRSD